MVAQISIILLGLVALYGIFVVLSRNGLLLAGHKEFSTNEPNSVQNLFFKTVFTLLGYVARQDGPVNKQEIKRTETYMASMNLNANNKREAIRLFKIGAAPQFEVTPAINEFKRLALKSPNLTQILLVYLVNLARVDGLLVSQEVNAVQKIANGLGFSSIAFEQLLKMISSQDRFNDDPLKQGRQHHHKHNHQEQQTDKEYENNKQRGSFSNDDERSTCAYDALGLSPKASDSEVKKAYRALANQFHPDKLIGQGLPPFMVNALTERFKYIQSAYDCIKKDRANA